MSNFPTTFAEDLEMLMPNGLGENGGAAVTELHKSCFVICQGLMERHSGAIGTMARQPHIREYCPSDATIRFDSKDSTREWLSKGRVMFPLMKKIGNAGLQLVGYGWTGPQTKVEVPGGQTTFAVRIGEEEGRGQHIAEPFSKAIIAATASVYDAKDFWLETWKNNYRAYNLYQKIGFKVVDEWDGERLSADKVRVKDKRVFMRLPNDLLQD